MAVYDQQVQSATMSYKVKERDIYGSSRVGMYTDTVEMIGASLDTTYLTHLVEFKQYELSNHLGNVLTVITDLVIPKDWDSDATVDNYHADIVTATDYYAFGVTMNERNFSEGSYRYGLNGMEKCDEVHSNNGDFYLADYRSYDARLGRWLSQDPIVKPWESPYAGFGNNPIYYVDPSGLTPTGSGDPLPSDKVQEYGAAKRFMNKLLGKGYRNDANKFAVENGLTYGQLYESKGSITISMNTEWKSYNVEGGTPAGYMEWDEYTFNAEGMIYERMSGDLRKITPGEYSVNVNDDGACTHKAWSQGNIVYPVGFDFDAAERQRQWNDYLRRVDYARRTSEIFHDPFTGEVIYQPGVGALQAPMIDPIDIFAGIGGIRSAFAPRVNFTNTTAMRMADPARAVDLNDLYRAVNTPGLPDPQGVAGATAHYTTILRNGKAYNMQVIYNQSTDTILHFHYTPKAIGPLGKAPR